MDKQKDKKDKEKVDQKGTETDSVKDKQRDKKKDEHKDTERDSQKDKDEQKSAQKGKQKDMKVERKDKEKVQQKDEEKAEDKNSEKEKQKDEDKAEGKDTEKDKQKYEDKPEGKDVEKDKQKSEDKDEENNKMYKKNDKEKNETKDTVKDQRMDKEKTDKSDVAVPEEPKVAGQREITEMLKARPEPTADDVRACDLIPTAIKMSGILMLMSPDDAENKPEGERDKTAQEVRTAEGNVTEKDVVVQAEEPKVTPAAILSRRKHLFLLTVSLLAGVCLMFLVALFIVKSFKKRATIESLACTTLECQKAVKFVESFTDYAVKPCDDLYRHVCGRWLRKVSKPTSFMADVARNFSVHRTTLLASDKKRSGRHAAVLEAVSKYYRSCTAYFSRKRDVTEIVTELFRNLNITPTTWLQWENEHPVFKELVRLSVVYQLPSFFLVSIEQNAGNATWTIYRGKAFLHRISDGNLYEIGGRNATDYFRKVLKTIGEAHATDWTMKTIIEIDKTLAEAFNNDSDAVTQTQPFGELVCGNFPPKVWLGTLNSIPGDKPQANENTTVYAPSFSRTCQDLNRALRNPNSRIRTLYALALIAAEVLRFDYQLSAEDVPDVTKLAAMCYEATRFAFEDIWVQVISAFLSMTKNSETSIRDYFQYIINGISMYTKWMDEVDRAAVEKMLNSFKLLSFSTGVLSDEQLRCSRYDSQTDVSSKDYVLNRVRVYDRVVGRCFGIKSSFPASNLKDLLGTGLLVDAVSKLVVIPHMFGTPPIYYEKLEEQYINFALPGSLLARKIFRVVFKGATWRKRTLEKVQWARKCYSEYSSTFHSTLDEEQFNEAFSTWQAVRAAFSAKLTFDHHSIGYEGSRVEATNAIFFKRACLSLCASASAPRGPNSLSGRVAHAACLFAVGTIPQFRSSFKCWKKDAMYPFLKCSPS
ncbi:uncharacterized protein LOC144103603 [Amblyomma americanum]